MSKTGNDWLTLHRVRFASSRDGTNAPLPGPSQARAWRFYPSSPLNEAGMRTNVSDVWGGIGIHDTKSDAEAALDAIKTLPWYAETVERWHALLLPVRHHGETNWRGTLSDATLACAADDPGGPLVVITSAGFNAPGPADMPRIADFNRRVEQVKFAYRTLPGNRVSDVFSGARVDGHDGMTVTLWADVPAMMAAAYKDGVHREQMDLHRAAAMIDRSSFTRNRVLAATGTWDGVAIA
ncbi:MAG: hypothetical protein ACK50Q_00235 [Labrys sp. (in: a-proteobacteria)]|jgi:hypothetical protein